MYDVSGQKKVYTGVSCENKGPISNASRKDMMRVVIQISIRIIDYETKSFTRITKEEKVV